MRLHVTQDQMRSAGADTVPAGAFARGIDQLAMRGKAEVIIAAESDVFATVYSDVRALRCLQHAATSAQSFSFEQGQLSRK
jgi:hypothetical protein